MQQPVIVACGVGRDSVGMLCRMHREKQRPDAILFANVGSEKRETYEFIPHLRAWLKEVDFPKLTIVRYRPASAPYQTLEGNMVLNATLPGATFNIGSCTLKFKVEPQNRWTQMWFPAQEAWSHGLKVRRLIGFECDEEYRLKRADAKAHSGRLSTTERNRYEFGYPLLQDWHMTLGDCIEEIQHAGLPVPCKSACFFCPNQKEPEVYDLSDEDRSRIILMELVAEPYNRKAHGLWRRPRKADGRPGSITQYILENGLPFIPLDQIASKVVLNPACKKAKNGGTHTFDPPHNAERIADLLKKGGHYVPPVVLATDGDGHEPGIYLEDLREAPPDVESQVHEEIVYEEEEHEYFGEGYD